MRRGVVVNWNCVMNRLMVRSWLGACRSLVLRNQMMGHRSRLESFLFFFILLKWRNFSGCFFLLQEMRWRLEYMEIRTSFMKRSCSRLKRMVGSLIFMVSRSWCTLMDWHRVVKWSGMLSRLLMVNLARSLLVWALMNRCLVMDWYLMLNRTNGSLMWLFLMLNWCNDLVNRSLMLSRNDSMMRLFLMLSWCNDLVNWSLMLSRNDSMMRLFLMLSWFNDLVNWSLMLSRNDSMMGLYLMLFWCKDLVNWSLMLSRMNDSKWRFMFLDYFSVMLNLLMINSWGFLMNWSAMMRLFFGMNWLRMRSLLLEMSDGLRAVIFRSRFGMNNFLMSLCALVSTSYMKRPLMMLVTILRFGNMGRWSHNLLDFGMLWLNFMDCMRLLNMMRLRCFMLFSLMFLNLFMVY